MNVVTVTMTWGQIGGLLGGFATILVVVLGAFAHWMRLYIDAKFEAVDAKFETVNATTIAKFELVNATMTAKFDSVNVRLEAIEDRLGKIEKRVERLEGRADSRLVTSPS